jgi:hypothetical protein
VTATKPPWTGDDEWMERWVNEQLDTLPRWDPLRDETPEALEERAAIRAAVYRREIGPLRELVRRTHPRLAPFINLPIGEGRTQGDRRPREEPESIERALDDVYLIYAIWQHEYGRQDRPDNSVTAEEIAARRNGIDHPDDQRTLRLAMRRDERQRPDRRTWTTFVWTGQWPDV